MKKRMRQLTTVNSTLIFKYTCTVAMYNVCVIRRYIHAEGTFINIYVSI